MNPIEQSNPCTKLRRPTSLRNKIIIRCLFFCMLVCAVFDSMACICYNVTVLFLPVSVRWSAACLRQTVAPSDCVGITSSFLANFTRILYLHEGFLRVIDFSLGVPTRSFRAEAELSSLGEIDLVCFQIIAIRAFCVF